MNIPEKATRPTMYFIGVSTSQSSIMKLFPMWASELGLKDAEIKGIDIEIHAEPQKYSKVVEFIKNDGHSFGALITTHKIDIYNAAKDYFEYLDPYAKLFSELSSISKKEGRFEGYAKDPISSGLAMKAFIPRDFWKDRDGEAFIMGAGGSAIAIGASLINSENGENIPSRIIVSNRSNERLDSIKSIFDQLNPKANVAYHLTPKPEDNDAILDQLKPYSLVVNATGLGKDRPGSPLTDFCSFPSDSLVWELNYRGNLRFLEQANLQKQIKSLHVEDGWIYFIHGWTQVISEVFHVDIDEGMLKRLINIAERVR